MGVEPVLKGHRLDAPIVVKDNPTLWQIQLQRLAARARFCQSVIGAVKRTQDRVQKRFRPSVWIAIDCRLDFHVIQ